MTKLGVMVRTLISVVVMTALMSCATGPKAESAGEYLDDSVITTKVKALLAKDDILRSFQIGVETYRGVVQLSGFVDTQDDIDRAGEITQDVGGVESVKNNLLLK